MDGHGFVLSFIDVKEWSLSRTRDWDINWLNLQENCRNEKVWSPQYDRKRRGKFNDPIVFVFTLSGVCAKTYYLDK